MADRMSARIFAALFTMLGGDGPLDKALLARRIWEMQERYDFHPCQMAHGSDECLEALFKLGLARRGVDPDCPEYGETILHGPERK